jgi:hypothetical protein
MSKRKERVAPPPKAGGWDFRFATSDAAKGWDQICTSAASYARTAWETITADPRKWTDRQHQLAGGLGKRVVNGVELEQWQHEVTGAGRIWYCIEDKTLTIWMTDASVGHPKRTE